MPDGTVGGHQMVGHDEGHWGESRARIHLTKGAEHVHLLEGVLAASADPIVAVDRMHRCLFANPAAARVLGHEPFQMEGKTWDELDLPAGLIKSIDEQIDRVLDASETIRDEATFPTAQGERVFEYILTPVVSSDDATEGVVASMRDITDREHGFDVEERRMLLEREREARALAEAGRERMAFLAQASTALASSLGFRQTVETVTRLAVPLLADWCSVDVVAADDSVERVAETHDDQARAELTRELRSRYPGHLQALGILEAVKSGQPVVYPEVDDVTLARIASDEGHADLMRKTGAESGVIVPLIARGKSLGTLSLAMAGSGRRFGPDEVDFALHYSRRCAQAIDNARLYEERAYIARTLQDALLPPGLPHIDGIEVAAGYIAAGEVNEVGGDFYDVFQTRDGWFMAIGDVCGKGAEAAALTGLARHTIRAGAARDDDPVQVIDILNASILKEGSPERFVTVACGVLRTRPDGADALLACAGHPPPLVLRADGRVETPVREGMLVGVFEVLEVATARVHLGAGDAIVMYTDGVAEARSGDDIFGLGRVKDLISAKARSSAQELVEAIQAAAKSFEGAELRDDSALLVLRVPS